MIKTQEREIESFWSFAFENICFNPPQNQDSEGKEEDFEVIADTKDAKASV